MKGKLLAVDVFPLVKKYYQKEGNLAGGCLHICLDDGNMQESYVKFCKEYALKNGDEDGVVLAEMMLKMSYSQREELYNMNLREP